MGLLLLTIFSLNLLNVLKCAGIDSNKENVSMNTALMKFSLSVCGLAEV